jgi:hypothetical protein
MLDAGRWVLGLEPLLDFQHPASNIYSLQEKESSTSHPGGVREGSQGLRSNPWEIHESAEHPEGMRA